jgi:hypothetical protein
VCANERTLEGETHIALQAPARPGSRGRAAAAVRWDVTLLPPTAGHAFGARRRLPADQARAMDAHDIDVMTLMVDFVAVPGWEECIRGASAARRRRCRRR